MWIDQCSLNLSRIKCVPKKILNLLTYLFFYFLPLALYFVLQNTLWINFD